MVIFSNLKTGETGLQRGQLFFKLADIERNVLFFR